MAKATQKPQSRDATPQSRVKLVRSPQSRAKFLKPWNECVAFLRKDFKEMCNTSKDSYELIRVIEGTELMQGVQAEVNWFTGGNSYVTLSTAVAAKSFKGPGVYLAKVKWPPFVGEEDWGPQTPLASICNLRWKGTNSYFEERANDAKVAKLLGKKKYDHLLQMLDSPWDLEEGLC
jgi:hypothetical protein